MNQVMGEVTVAGHRYQIGRMSAMQQFHLTRRLGPLLVVAGISVELLRNGMKADLDDLVGMAGPVMELLSKMTDEEADAIVFPCLAVCKRNVESLSPPWAPVTTAGPDGKPLIMFADMEMPELVRLVLEVLKVTLGNFLKGLGEEPTSQSS